VNAAPHFQIGGATRDLQTKSKPEDHLSVVCFGASAGGFEAYCTILSLLPADTGMAYIIVHHQAADGKSLLVEILPRVTKMPVVLVANGENVKANHVYVVPAGMQVTMDGDAFRLSPLARIFHRLRHRYDHFSARATSPSGGRRICGLDSKPPLRRAGIRPSRPKNDCRLWNDSQSCRALCSAFWGRFCQQSGCVGLQTRPADRQQTAWRLPSGV
jgi:hypothetical protein